MLNPINFQLVLQRAPAFDFFVQKLNLPYVRLPDFDIPTPLLALGGAGTHLEWGYLNVTFKVNEDFSNYIEIFNWIQGLGFPDSNREYANLEQMPVELDDGLRSDISLIVMNSIKQPFAEFKFISAFPVALSELNFDVTLPTTTYLNATATFRYDQYHIKSLPL